MGFAGRALGQTALVRQSRKLYDAFAEHDDMSLAAAVAFYTTLSFAPLVMLIVTFGGLLGASSQGELVGFFGRQLGPRAVEVTEAVVESAKREGDQASWWRTAVSVVLLLVSSSAVFGQVQASLNRIWSVAAAPEAGWWRWLRRRVLSLGMVLAAMFILLVSLVLSAVVDRIVPTGEGVLGRSAVTVVSFFVAALLFAAIFKVLPDARIGWRQVWVGALVTAALFTAGKFLIGLYLAWSGVTESYGHAAGGLIALLMWVYYSTIILFIGAEVTRLSTPRAPKPRAASVRAKS